MGSNDELELNGVPIQVNQDDYVKPNPSMSYSLSFISQKLNIGKGKALLRKKQINEKIIENIKEICDDNNLPLLFVIFYSNGELEEVGWRELFLKEN